MRCPTGVRFRTLLLLLALASSTTALCGEPGSPARPNVVLILADDMGFADLGCYGSEIETPHLDRLAAHGLRFSQFYNTGRCWPTRASLLTGLYPHQARMAMNYGEQAPPGYSGLVPTQARMIPELLEPQGYRSYHVGKWHLNRGGQPNPTWPVGRGFAESLFLGGHNSYFKPEAFFRNSEPVKAVPTDFYMTDAFSAQAVDFLKEHAQSHADKPFFLYLAHIAPHFPLHARADDVARFRGRYRAGWDHFRERRHARQRALGLVNCDLSPRDPDAKAWDSLSEAERDEWDSRMATYAAMIHAIDRGVGQIVEQVKAMNAFDNTLILFLSDNGSSAEFIVRGGGHKAGAAPGSAETFRCLEVGWSNVANTPFRFHKMWMHEGGIASPLIVHWPARIADKGTLRHQVGHVIDIAPTLLELTGGTYPAEFDGKPTTPLPGRSLLPALENKPVERELLFWEHIGNKALRRGDWKLVAEDLKPWELYDLKTDRSELHNLAADKPDLTQKMVAEWESYAKEIGVVDWNSLPQSKGREVPGYRRK